MHSTLPYLAFLHHNHPVKEVEIYVLQEKFTLKKVREVWGDDSVYKVFAEKV